VNTTISNAVQQVLPQGNQAANQKKTSEKTTNQSEPNTKTTETRADNIESGSAKTDSVEITNSRFLVSEANRAASETEIEDIDQAVEKIQELSGKNYYENEKIKKYMRIVADHMRACVFLAMDGVIPSNKDQGYGIIDIHSLWGNCNCVSSARPHPYQVQAVYTAGLPTGTANQPDMLLALTTYSTIIMNEIIGFGNEAPSAVGVQEFSNQEYREIRTKLGKKIYGSSAKAQLISDLLAGYRKTKYVKLGW